MKSSLDRRRFMQRTALTGAGLWVSSGGALAQTSANEKLDVAIIGVRGRGAANLEAVARTENIVALCDVDDNHLGEAAKAFPQAGKYNDFRRMLERRDIDAVVVSTPD